MSKLSKPIKESNKCFNLRAPLGACNKRTKKIRAPEPLRKDQLAVTAHALIFADVFTVYFFDDIEFFFKKKYPNQMKEMDSNGKKNEENSRKKKRKSIEVSASDLAVDVARLLNVSFVGVDWENPPDGVKSMADDLGGDQSRLLERCKAYSCRFCVAFGEGSTVNRQIFSSNRTAHIEANHPGILKELSLHLSCGKDLDVLTSEMVKHIELCEEKLSKSSNNYFSSLSVPLGAKHLTNDIRQVELKAKKNNCWTTWKVVLHKVQCVSPFPTSKHPDPFHNSNAAITPLKSQDDWLPCAQYDWKRRFDDSQSILHQKQHRNGKNTLCTVLEVDFDHHPNRLPSTSHRQVDFPNPHLRKKHSKGEQHQLQDLKHSLRLIL